MNKMENQDMNESERTEWAKKVDPERNHLERLFQDRINFHIVFASIFMVGLSQVKEPGIKIIALVTMTIVSCLLALAILRSYRLVGEALKDIRLDKNHPYTTFQNRVRFPGNANHFLVAIPIILTLFFAIVTCSYLPCLCKH